MDKVETLKRYKFSLAFENSNEEDYVTEKFFQSLVAGKALHFFLLMFSWVIHLGFFMFVNMPLWYYVYVKLRMNL